MQYFLVVWLVRGKPLICETKWTMKLRIFMIGLLFMPRHKKGSCLFQLILVNLGVANQTDLFLYVMTEKYLSKAGTVSSRVYIMQSSPR